MKKKEILSKLGDLSFFRILKENLGVILGFLLVFFILTFSTEKFLTVSNLTNVLRQVTMNMVLSCGLCMVLIYGAIDLSVPAILGMTACLSCGFIDRWGMGWIPACLLALVFALAAGAFNALIITNTTIPPFIITLAMQNVCRGVCRVYTNEKTIILAEKDYIFIGSGSINGVPVQLIWVLATVLITVFILRRTRLGRHIYAAGGNRQAAKYSGINVKRIGFFVYMYAALMAGLAGIYTAGRTYAAMYTTGDRAETHAISAIVLGGVSMSGGVGGMFGVVFGVFLIGILNNGLNLLGIDSSWQYVVQGIVIIAAVCIDFFRKKQRV